MPREDALRSQSGLVQVLSAKPVPVEDPELEAIRMAFSRDPQVRRIATAPAQRYDGGGQALFRLGK